MRPLEGITVVALEQVIAGPFATRQLAELGARVIKIERPGAGDASRSYDRTVQGLSSHFVWTNRSKESLGLDVKHPAAKEIIARLVARADVFLQNLAPGAAERLGLGAAQLRQRHPRLIWCGISGYGPEGPYAQKKAYDLLVQCEAGLLSVTGTPEVPAKAGIPVADIAAGMYAFSSVLAALLRRARTGEGATLDITMFEALGEWMGFPAYFTGYGGSAPPRSGAYHATIVPYGPFRAGDGGTVFLSIQNEREFARFCEQVLRKPGLAADPRFACGPARQQNREAMHAEIDAVFGKLESPYERAYYTGIAWERYAKAQLAEGIGPGAHHAFHRALELFEEAEELAANKDPDPILRWNRVVRELSTHPLLRIEEDRAPESEMDFGDGPPS